MKTIEFIECRKCGAKVHTGKKITLSPDEEIEILPKVVGRCDLCRQRDDRTASALRQRNANRPGRIPRQ